MSNADPGLLRLDCPEGETHYQAAYALGMSPEDEDWFDTAGDAVGYDDFGEWLPASMFAQVKTEVYDGIRISLTKKAIRVWCVPLRNYEQQGE